MHLDIINGITKDNNITEDNAGTLSKTHNIVEDSSITEDINISKENNTTTGYCKICYIRYTNNHHKETDDHKEIIKLKKVINGRWREEVNELG